MAIVVTKTKEAPMTYGADNQTEPRQTDKNIAFGIGSIDKVLAKIGKTTDDNIYFGYGGTGDYAGQSAIVACGKLVSSKIVDVIFTPEVLANADTNTPASAPSITVKYIDPTDKTVKEVKSDLTSQAAIDAALATAKQYADDLKTALIGDATENGNTLKAVEDRIIAIENLIATTGDDDNVINKVSEIITWFAETPEGQSSAVTLIADVNANKTAIGTDNTAEEGQPSNATGLYKKIEDAVTKANNAIEGLDVSSNTVDGTNVHVTYKEENGIVTIESLVDDYATVTRTETSSTDADPKTNAALTVTNGSKLATGSDIEKVAGYAADLVKLEADARTKAINDLDLASTADDAHKTGTNVTVTMSQTDGKIKVESVAESYAEVTKTASTSNTASPKTNAAFAVTSGDENKLVKGKDLKAVAEYAADKAMEEMHRVDKKIADLRGDVTSDDAAVANVEVKTVAGEVNDVIVTTISAGVNRTGDAEGNGNRVLAATTGTGAVTGADIATIKSYVDDVVTDNTAELAVEAEGDDYITADVDSSNNKKINVAADVQVLTVGKEGAANSTLAGTANSLVDGADVAAKVSSFVNARVAEEINKLDVADSSVDGTNVHVTYKEEDGIVTIKSVSEDYATVTRTTTSSTADVPAANASLVVATDGVGGLVKGSDVSLVAAYVDDKAKEEAHRIDKKLADTIASLDASVYSAGTDDATYAAATDFVKVKVTEADGKLTGVNVGVKTVDLANTVGMVKVTEGENAGKWVAGEGMPAGTVNGLATAADVAAEIVADEEVIAAALNDHESRLQEVEDYKETLDVSTSLVISSDAFIKTVNATANSGVDGTTLNVAEGTSTYQVSVTLDGKNAHVTSDSITVVNTSVIEELMKLLQTEKERADAAEKVLDASVKDHETRLQWIEL